MKISIIVPVYNVQNYLEECVQSLLTQNYDDYEILLVDDGSTDNSGKICDKYSINKFVRVFHKENGGLSDARNYGIEKAKGDYIIFVDSDDYIKENILKEIANTLQQKKSEILITRLIENYDGKDIQRDNNIMLDSKTNSKYDALKWILEKSYNTWPAVKYIVSRDFLNNNRLRFKSGFLHEDIEWTSRLCVCGQDFAYFEPVWYVHRMNRPSSITNKINEKRIIDVIKIAYDIIADKYCVDLDKLGLKERKMLINRIMISVYSILFKCIYLEKDKIKDVSKELYSRKQILNYAPRFKHKIFAMFIKIFGLETTVKIAKVIK